MRRAVGGEALTGIWLAPAAWVRKGLDQLEDRTKRFAIEAARLCAKLEGVRGLLQVAWQLAAAGSVASNHRATRRSRSEREFAAKLQIVNEEVDESTLWLEIALAPMSGVSHFLSTYFLTSFCPTSAP